MRMTPEDWEEIDKELGLDKFWDTLEELLRAAGTHPSRDGEAKIVDQNKMEVLKKIGEVFRCEGSDVDFHISGIGSHGYVSINGQSFHYDGAKLLLIKDALDEAMNFEVSPRNDGKVSIGIGVRNVTKKLN